MMFRPVQTLAIILIKAISRRYNLSDGLINIFKAFFTTIPYLIASSGIIQVLPVLWSIRSFIRGNLTTLLNINALLRINPNINLTVANTIIEAITPYWKSCIKYPKIFYNLYNLYLFTMFLGAFKPIFKIFTWSIKSSLGIILTTIGILWNESLLALPYLKDFAFYIKDLIENYSNFKIPLISNGSDLPKDSSWLSLIGLILLGVIGTISLIVITDNFIPGGSDIIRSIPYLGSMVETVNSNVNSFYNTIFNSYNSVIDYFYGNNITDNNIPTPDSITRSAPDSISRSSSDSSTSTIRLSDNRTNPDPGMITPPISRSGTPLPLPSDMTDNFREFTGDWD